MSDDDIDRHVQAALETLSGGAVGAGLADRAPGT